MTGGFDGSGTGEGMNRMRMALEQLRPSYMDDDDVLLMIDEALGAREEGIVTTEHSCGWCGARLNDGSPVFHALVCEKQPYRIYREAILEELMLELGVRDHRQLPEWVRRAMKNAEGRTQDHVARIGWRYR
jgi:hypothetical protein